MTEGMNWEEEKIVIPKAKITRFIKPHFQYVPPKKHTSETSSDSSKSEIELPPPPKRIILRNEKNIPKKQIFGPMPPTIL